MKPASSSRKGEHGAQYGAGKQGILWGLLGALVANLCCVGPLVAIILGHSGGALLLGWALPAYRPYFLVASLLLLGGGIFYMLGHSRRSCSLEQHRRNLWLYPAIALVSFAVGYLLFLYGLPALAQRLKGQPSAPVQTAAGDRATGSAPFAPQGLRIVTLQVDAPA